MQTEAAADTFIAWQGWGMTGAAVALLILLVWILVWLLPFPSRSLEDRLADPEARARLRDRLGGTGAFGRYRLAIRDLNNWLDAWFGPSTSGQAMERCIAIAFVYPAVLFIVTIIVAGTVRGRIAPHEVGVFLLITAVAGYLAHRAFRALYRVGTNFWRFVGGDSDLIRLIARVVLGALAVILAFAIAFVIASTAAGAFAEAGTIILAIFAAFALAFALAGVLAAAGTAAAMGMLLALTVAALAFAGHFAFLLLLFFVLLPMLNALLDWMSWIVTRFFLRRVAQVSQSWKGAGLLFLELSADLAAAILLFLALVVLLPNGIEIVNAVLSVTGRPPFDWRDIVFRAYEAPLSEGLFVVGMLITTLVPTFVHITRGLAGIAAAWTPGAAEAAAGLRHFAHASGQDWADPAPATPGTLHASYNEAAYSDVGVFDEPGGAERFGQHVRPSVQQQAARALRLSRLWYLPAGLVALGLFVGLVALLEIAMRELTGISLGEFLVRLAFCASSWSHGECPA